MTPTQQLKQCQNSWSAFTLRQEAFAFTKGHKQGYLDGRRDALRRAVEICRELRKWDSSQAQRICNYCARAIEAEIPPTPTESVVREG